MEHIGLTSLYLDYNYIRKAGAAELAIALRLNNTLTKVCLLLPPFPSRTYVLGPLDTVYCFCNGSVCEKALRSHKRVAQAT